jgi:hypothetical protein
VDELDFAAIPASARTRTASTPRSSSATATASCAAALATHRRVATTTFRNWDLPQRRQIFAGVTAGQDDRRPSEIEVHSYLGEPTSATLADDVLDGLTRPFKELPPKHFYDARGAELFDRICELPEYYPTRTERAILEPAHGEIVELTGAPRSSSSARARRQDADPARRDAATPARCDRYVPST